MDARVASYLDHARRKLSAGRTAEAEGLERQALMFAEMVPGGGREERGAVLALRSDRLVRQADHAGALAATREALTLTDGANETFALRLDEARLLLATNDPGAGTAVDAVVTEGLAQGRANWPMARAFALQARARDRAGDAKGAAASRSQGRDRLAGTPNPPAALLEALREPFSAPPPTPGTGAASPGAGDASLTTGGPAGSGTSSGGPGTGDGTGADRAAHRSSDPRGDAPAPRSPGRPARGLPRDDGRPDLRTVGRDGRGPGRAGGGVPSRDGDPEGPPGTAARKGDATPEAVPASGVVDEQAFAAVMADLDGLIGLGGVKAEVHRTGQLLRMRALRKAAGLKVADVSLHLVFCGGPGTGKTTVARLYGRLYHALGLLGTDRLVEVDRSGLVSGYLGQTATLVNTVVDSALDGVLFVDEAYALASGGPKDFGQEAISTLLKRMEDDRERLAVICAGYPREMDEFLCSNSGLASRFAETITFDDYGPGELLAILERFCTESDYALDDAARTYAAEVLGRWHAERDDRFANARAVRNLFDDVISSQADRLLSGGTTPDAAAMRILTTADVERAALSG
ncbi:AAA family ATPase [Patulibacter minatonensis]|uniref:AAA family ATPase n=1 Tax=Patulibacter minatonensis TaxID=298163 RepID=UPI0006865DBC|nr:AAA family ATPase [Patulibacter minatonensis]